MFKKIKEYISLGALVAATSLSPLSCAHVQNKHNDKNDNNVTDELIHKIDGPNTRVDIELTLEEILFPVGDKLYGLGSGVILHDDDENVNYLFTVNHLNPPTEIEGIKVKETIMTADGIEIELIKYDETKDLALFKLKGEHEYFKGKIAKETEEGDYIVGFGYPRGFKAFLFGRVVGTDQKMGITLTEDKIVVNLYEFNVIDTHASPGNSGCGIYVINNGEPELAGVLQIGYSERAGHIGISPTKNVREFIKDTPLEDEYL